MIEPLADAFSNFFTWMEALPPIWAYVTLLIIAYGENVVPPIPGDMVVVFGGYMAGVGLLDLWLVIVISTAGGAAGFMTVYEVGRRVGHAAIESERYGWLPRGGFEKARRWMERYGYGVVAANRFLSGARSVISLTVGAAQMKPGPTLLWSTVSAALWCTLIASGGYVVGDNWRLVVEYLRAYGRWMLALLAVVDVIAFVRWYWFSNESTTDEGSKTSSEVDPYGEADPYRSTSESGSDSPRASSNGADAPPASGSTPEETGNADRVDL